MKIRLKFTKTGPIRYVGHLDFMRCFQKGIKKSGLSAVYSSGFNPHMLMSFAAPLGTGEETLGDYVDVDFAYRDRALRDAQEAYRLKDLGLDNDDLPDPPEAEALCRILTDSMPEGVSVVGASRVGLTKGSKAMALVRYASWNLVPYAPEEEKLMNEQAESFLRRDSIPVIKKTKNGEREVDIRPMIRECSVETNGTVRLLCAAGSSVNLKPESALHALFACAGKELQPYAYRHIRVNLYDENLCALSDLGSPF